MPRRQSPPPLAARLFHHHGCNNVIGRMEDIRVIHGDACPEPSDNPLFPTSPQEIARYSR
ncbi:MAG: hypothetical protein IJJ33_05915 [Victivallales bacterium]|nr:hypothetical protein [Victivallales bacterium]